MLTKKQMIETIKDIIDSCKTGDKIHTAFDIVFNKIYIDFDIQDATRSEESNVMSRKRPVTVVKIWQGDIVDNYYWLIMLNQNIDGKLYLSFTDVKNFRMVNTDFYEEKC